MYIEYYLSLFFTVLCYVALIVLVISWISISAMSWHKIYLLAKKKLSNKLEVGRGVWPRRSVEACP